VLLKLNIIVENGPRTRLITL